MPIKAFIPSSQYVKHVCRDNKKKKIYICRTTLLFICAFFYVLIVHYARPIRVHKKGRSHKKKKKVEERENSMSNEEEGRKAPFLRVTREQIKNRNPRQSLHWQ